MVSVKDLARKFLGEAFVEPLNEKEFAWCDTHYATGSPVSGLFENGRRNIVYAIKTGDRKTLLRGVVRYAHYLSLSGIPRKRRVLVVAQEGITIQSLVSHVFGDMDVSDLFREETSQDQSTGAFKWPVPAGVITGDLI